MVPALAATQIVTRHDRSALGLSGLQLESATDADAFAPGPLKFDILKRRFSLSEE
ncbi:hypothetical protein [Aureimonas sp. N4]|uniref:hypothetical protein n=1 Tax=Aureimonas sp. N4 TaxID=1638165 RepID=UPI00178D0224|nr:hypothetical protein [Aureimonas sp. N4]